MKLIVLAALAGTMLPGAARPATSPDNKQNENHRRLAVDEEAEANKEAEATLYSLNALWREYEHAQHAIETSKGNHQEIDTDFNYFHSLLLQSAASGKNNDEVILKLKKSYARKHKQRAAAELQQQSELVKLMEKKLAEHESRYHSLKSKYKKVLSAHAIASFDMLASKLSLSAKDLTQTMENHTKSAAKYDEAYQKIKKGLV